MLATVQCFSLIQNDNRNCRNVWWCHKTPVWTFNMRLWSHLLHLFSNAKLLISAQLKYSCSCLVLYKQCGNFNQQPLSHLSCWKARRRSWTYLRHDSEGLPPCVQRDRAPGDAINGDFAVSGGETQQSGEQSALPRTCSTQQTHLHTHTHTFS